MGQALGSRLSDSGFVGKHFIAACGLGAIQRLVGIYEQGVDAAVVWRHFGHADRDGEREWLALGRGQAHLGHSAADAFGHHRGAVGRGVGQQGGKFFAPQAAQQVGIAQGMANGFGACADGHVARLVAVPVVDVLEVVDVDHEHGTGLAMAAAVVEQGRAAFKKRSAVEQPAERIACGQLAQLGLQGLVGADVEAPQQVGQLAFHFDQAGRERTPAGVVFANEGFHGIDLAVAVHRLGEALAGLGVVQQIGQEQGFGWRLESQAGGQRAVDEVHAAAFNLGQHHVAGAGVQDEAQQCAALFNLAGAAGHPHFKLPVGQHQLA